MRRYNSIFDAHMRRYERHAECDSSPDEVNNIEIKNAYIVNCGCGRQTVWHSKPDACPCGKPCT